MQQWGAHYRTKPSGLEAILIEPPQTNINKTKDGPV